VKDLRPAARFGIHVTKTAADVLKAKAHQSVHTIAPAASVFDAVKLMSVKTVGALLVMEGEEVVGIVTESKSEGRHPDRRRTRVSPWRRAAAAP